MKKLLITIDGPAGAGKTTVSRELARRLGYVYVDTGALYRGVAWEARKRNIAADDDRSLERLCQAIDLRFVRTPAGTRLYGGDTDISEEIRTPEMSMMASAVSARPVVRQALLEIQRRLGREKNAVFEGRDMGTVVFPEADVKFFLTADVIIRAKRRHRELSEKSGQTLENVAADMKRRDADDSSRAVAPLKPAADAVIVDSTELSADAVVARMLAEVESKRF